MARMPAGPARSHRTHYLVAAFVAALILAVSASGFAWAENDITLTVDGETTTLSSRAEDVAAFLKDAGVGFDADDVVNPAPDTRLRDGLAVTVRHSVPVRVVLGDRELDLDVVGSTVADALVAAGADPTAGMSVTPSLDVPLEPNMRVVATDVFVRLVQKEKPLAFEVVTVEDPEKPRGFREVRREGREGKALQLFRVVVTGGKPGEPAFQAERVVEPPASEVVVVGTARKPLLVASRSSAPAPEPAPAPQDGRKLSVVATAYAPGSGGADTTTATGARASRGVIAVDPDVIPLGTRVYVPGYGYAVAADVGGAIRGNRIDVCFDTHAEAIAWGRRSVTIIIVP